MAPRPTNFTVSRLLASDFVAANVGSVDGKERLYSRQEPP